MSTDVLARYAVFKDSGVEWLGEVPLHWNVIRLKDIGKSIIGLTYSPDDVLDNDAGVLVLRSSNIQQGELSLFNNVYVDKKIPRNLTLRVGDILICSRNGSRNLIGKNICIDQRVAGQTFGAFMTVYRSQYFKFLQYFFNSRIFESQSGLFMSATINQLTINTLNNFHFTLPPVTEQTAIAAYLDTRIAQIDRQIGLFGKKAMKYSDLRQSLIDEIVVRGLDKSAPMKDSEVEWFDRVPKHWKMKRLKELVSIQNSNVDKKAHNEEIAVRLCNYVDVYKNEFINSSLSLDFMLATADESEIKKFGIKKNDVLITKDSETADDIAIPALATETLDGVLCGYHLTQIRTNPKHLLGSYLFRLFQTKSYGHRFAIAAKGITRVGLGQAAIADALTPVPPLSEQQAISAYLDKKTAHMDRILAAINTQIDRLKELRKALINDVVTGRIKVVSKGQAA